ncbi:22894_t:CDS:2, partial [Racocetra persica]
ENYINDLEIGEEGTLIQTLRERALRTRYNNTKYSKGKNKQQSPKDVDYDYPNSLED